MLIAIKSRSVVAIIFQIGIEVLFIFNISRSILSRNPAEIKLNSAPDGVVVGDDVFC